MSANAATIRPVLKSPEEDSASSVRMMELLSQLLEEIENQGSVSLGNAAGSDSNVLLDCSLSGVRCQFTRLPRKDKPVHSLSPRELEIARMVALGHPNKVIAAVLEISLWTVSTYIRRIFAKLGVSSRAAMVAQLHEANLLGRDAKTR